MSDARCHSCGAAVPPEAQWCSLCFADLRIPAAVHAPVSVPAAPEPAPAPATALAPAPAPTAPAPAVAVPAPAPAPTVEVAKESTWPCPRCTAAVPLASNSCPECGAGFLAGVTQPTSAKLPLVGDLGRMSQGQRLLIGAGISVALMVVFIVILFVGGTLFG